MKTKFTIISILSVILVVLISSLSSAAITAGDRGGAILCGVDYACKVVDDGVCPGFYDDPLDTGVGSPDVCKVDDFNCCSTEFWETNKPDNGPYPQMIWMNDVSSEAVDPTHRCCGNAPNEYYTTSQVDDSQACCNEPTDCVYDGKCYTDMWNLLVIKGKTEICKIDFEGDNKLQDCPDPELLPAACINSEWIDLGDLPPDLLKQCTNDVKDAGETGIDCGGLCPACDDSILDEELFACFDGEQNYNEEDIDCGGPVCEPCYCNEEELDPLDPLIDLELCFVEATPCQILFGPNYILDEELGECVLIEPLEELLVNFHIQEQVKADTYLDSKDAQVVIVDHAGEYIVDGSSEDGYLTLDTLGTQKITVKVTKLGFEGVAKTLTVNQGDTFTFKLDKSTECQSDCTRNDGVCHAECFGINGCGWDESIYGPPSQYVCDQGKIQMGKGWETNAYNDPNTVVYCCTGDLPQEKPLVEEDEKIISSQAGTQNVQTYVTLLGAGPDGKPIKVHVTVWD